MNLSPDPRQLKTKVTLSIMNAPESGFFSGEYSASTALKSQDNLNVLNYDFEPSYTYSDGVTEPKYSSRLKVLSSLQNARIPEVNTAISASSCTFAYGAIVPNEIDPVLDRLKGPSKFYNPIFVDNIYSSNVVSQPDNFNNKSQHLPKIPFSGSGNVLTTYNIWHTVDGGTEAYKYIGPKVSGTNTGTLRTVKDPNYGAQVEVTSTKVNTTIKRIFPTAFDAVYENGAQIFNPDDSPPENIQATGKYGGNGFHINFSASNMEPNSSAIRIIIQPQVVNKDYINDFYIEFKLNSKPVLKIYDPYTNKYLTQADLIAPVLDKNTMNSYDLYVHFAGPNLLIGFSPDITRWNTVINFSGREVYCPPETDVFISLSNVNLKFRYSALIFNNFNNNQPVNQRKNYIIAEFRYSQKKISNIKAFLDVVKKYFESASYRINNNPRNTGFNDKPNPGNPNQKINPLDKNISYFADLRLDGKQFEDITFIREPKGNSADPDRKTVLFKLTYNTTIEGPAFLQCEIPHPSILAAEKVANIGGGNSGYDDYKFIDPILSQLFFKVGDITSWVENWSVDCQAELSNLSKISKTASITLKNIDSEEGQKFIDAIENNLLCVTIEAGYDYGQTKLQPFFQGFIKSTSYSRSGNDSTFTLACQDIASFVLGNLYFDKNMMIAGMRHDLAIDSIMACSGFWSYYYRNNADLFNGGQIYGIDLRLNSNSTNNQDLIKLNPLDKIYDKLGKLLERLNNPYSLPTFRWDENYGFKLECRNNYEDNDLKFTGLNDDRTAYLFKSNSSDPNFMVNFVSDLHGLLSSAYTIDTSVQSLAAGVRVFGVAMTGFLADERYDPNSVTLAFDLIQDQKKLLAYLANAPRNASQTPYVGFKKYLMWATQRNEIPDQEVLTRITNSIEIASRTPISNISFQCYVTKPLNFHGRFAIKVFQGQSVNSTDKYVYTSVGYNYDKNNNLITASVRGTNMPFALGGA
jgi:hypothetical protein